jgi:hypothetical protein
MLQALLMRHASSETPDFAPWLVAWTLSFLGFEKDCCPCFLWNKTILIKNINIDNGIVSIIRLLTFEQLNSQTDLSPFHHDR